MTQEAKPSLESKPEFEPTTIKRALISVADKTGLVDFAKGLADLGIEMEATNGTWRFLLQNGLAGWQVRQLLEDEFLSGKVKTLHPKIFMAILADRKSRNEMRELKKVWWEEHTYDLVVVNLYADKIDVGGYALLRAAAKNYHYVVSLCEPADYQVILQELSKNNRIVSQETSHRFAVKTLHYLEESARQALELLN